VPRTHTEACTAPGTISQTSARGLSFTKYPPISPSCRSCCASEPFSHLFEWAWAFSSSTRQVTVQIPTIPRSTPRVRTLPPVVVAAAVSTTGSGDARERQYRLDGSTNWQSRKAVTVLRSARRWQPPAHELVQRPTPTKIKSNCRSLILWPSSYSPP
jgi:hypothetical protein